MGILIHGQLLCKVGGSCSPARRREEEEELGRRCEGLFGYRELPSTVQEGQHFGASSFLGKVLLLLLDLLLLLLPLLAVL